jgi:hypothetical protein
VYFSTFLFLLNFLQEATKAVSIFNTYLNKGKLNGTSKQWMIETNEVQTILTSSLHTFLISYWGVAKTLFEVNSNIVKFCQFLCHNLYKI